MSDVRISCDMRKFCLLDLFRAGYCVLRSMRPDVEFIFNEIERRDADELFICCVEFRRNFEI